MEALVSAPWTVLLWLASRVMDLNLSPTNNLRQSICLAVVVTWLMVRLGTIRARVDFVYSPSASHMSHCMHARHCLLHLTGD
jgi:hypothetical protein